MNFTKENEVLIANKLKEKYSCDIIFKDESPYTLYCAKDIGSILEYSNIRHTLLYNKNEVIKIKKKTSNGEHYINYIPLTLFLKILNKSRKESSLNICKIININVHSNKFVCIESETIKSISNTFKGEKMIKQYKINNYFIDLYFEDYKLAIECDENHNNLLYDEMREIEINSVLNCTFIRYAPYQKDFNIFHILNKIYLHINHSRNNDHH
jgi:very-short-patch-repair endonuclease